MMSARCLLIVFMACMTMVVQAQHDTYLHRIIGTRDGLQSPKIYSLYQDADRKLWIGTELGLSIYNGYDFENIQYCTNGEILGRIMAISSDRMGGTWAGGDNGLFYFYKNGVKKIRAVGDSVLSISSIVTDMDGNVWIGDLKGLYRIGQDQIPKFYSGKADRLTNSIYAGFNNRVFQLATDRYGNVYSAGYDAVFMFKKNSKQLDTVWKNPDPRNHVFSVAAHSPDSVYWNCYEGHPMKKINGKIISLQHSRFIGRKVFTKHNKAYSLSSAGIADINGSEYAPIVSFEYLTNMVYDAMIDAEENIWLGSWEGLIKYRKTAFKTFAPIHPVHTDVFSMLELPNGELLIGGNRGMIFTKSGDSIVLHPQYPAMFELAELLSIYRQPDGTLWFGSGYQGVSRYKNGRVENWNEENSIINNNCEALLDAGNGKIFACTENGVYLINPNVSFDQTIEAQYPYKEKFSRYPELFGAVEGSQGAWHFYGSSGIYTLKNGLLEKDSITGAHVRTMYINKIVKDSNQNYWVATLGHGLLRCRYVNGGLKFIQKFDEKNTFAGNNILSVLIDKRSRIWMADYMSLTVLQKENGLYKATRFNEQDGLLSTYYQTLKLEQQANGTIWGISSMGVFAFHPDSINNNPLPPMLKINNILINPYSNQWQMDLGQQNKVAHRFSHQQNSIRFQYTAVSLTEPSKIRYAYRLFGLDTNWIYTHSRVVNYNFLPPGNYVFEIRAANNNGIWIEKPIRYNFIIRNPFWKTAWFIALALALAALIIYSIFKTRITNVRRKAAIRQQLAELEGRALRAQMNPHFIFNSLNAIQECIMLEQIDAAYEYLSRFSKLLRMVLNNSEKEVILLSDEIEMIRLYLQLESLRFKHSFNYTIEMDESLEDESILIPPLLLQPYIENAIWHGLINKDGDKKLSIQCIRLSNSVQCIIEDNGIGRRKASIIKAGKLGASFFESKGMKLSKQRMKLMSKEHPNVFNLNIEDLYDEQGNENGTRIIISILFNPL